MQRVCFKPKGKGNGILNDKKNVLSIGCNSVSIHAEHDAINKLKPLMRKRHLQQVDILVIRFNKTNHLQNSRPCANCVEKLRVMPRMKGYKVKHVYYSDHNGSIVKIKLNDLILGEQHYSRHQRCLAASKKNK